MNVLIINLTRFGDLLQMQPVILGLQAQGHSVGLICLENFAPATVLLQGLDYVYPLSGGAFLRSLEQKADQKIEQENAEQAPTKWTLAVQEVEKLILHVSTHFPVDLVINTTATLSARLLARRLTFTSQEHKNIPIWGFGLDDHGFGESGDLWTTFLQGASSERMNCPFNLVDMFRSVAKVANFSPLRGLQKPDESLLQEAYQHLNSQKPSECKGFVAFQLGASEQRRQWPVEHFVQLGAKLWQEERLCAVLLGSGQETELGKNYATLASASGQYPAPYLDFIGKTNILELAAVLSSCALIVSNDTGTMHLAAGLDVPVIGIFLSTAQAWDTGPYMQNACCLEPALSCHPCAFHKPCAFGQNQPCLYSISAEIVGNLAKQYLAYGHWDMEKKCHQQHVRIWTSRMDDSGFITLDGLSGHEHEERSHWLHLQRYFYRHILDNNLASEASDVEEIFAVQELHAHVAGLSPELRSSAAHTLEQCTQLLLLLKEHMQLLQLMPSKHSGPRIISLCNTMFAVLEKCPPLKALGHLWLVLFQERGAKWQSFLELVLSLRSALLVWHKTLLLEANNGLIKN